MGLQEAAFDYAFINLGIDNPTVDHPVIMTERLGTLSYSRASMFSRDPSVSRYHAESSV